MLLDSGDGSVQGILPLVFTVIVDEGAVHCPEFGDAFPATHRIAFSEDFMQIPFRQFLGDIWHGCVYPHFYYLCKRGLFVHEQIGPLRHLEQHRWMMATPIKILHSSRVLPFSDINMLTGNKDAS